MLFARKSATNIAMEARYALFVGKGLKGRKQDDANAFEHGPSWKVRIWQLRSRYSIFGLIYLVYRYCMAGGVR